MGYVGTFSIIVQNHSLILTQPTQWLNSVTNLETNSMAI